MKAFFLTKFGSSNKAFELRDSEIPTPSEGEVTIKVHTFGLNFADVVARRGLYPDAPPRPCVLGYDVAGFVSAVGKNVHGLKEGDRVTAMTRFGGYAEYATTMAEGVAVIPNDVDFATATALTTQGCTAYFCAEDSITLHKNDKVLIQAAAGGVGSILVQIAKYRSCEIFGTASSSKMEYLKEIGVDHPLDYTKIDFYQEIKKIGGGIDVAFDSLGGSSFSKGMKLLNPGGKMVFFGAAQQINGDKTTKLSGLKLAAQFGIFSPIPMLMNSKSLIGVNMLRIADDRPQVLQHCLVNVVRLLEEGVIKPKVGKVFKSNQLAEAHNYLESRKSIGKIAIEW